MWFLSIDMILKKKEIGGKNHQNLDITKIK
jgi:hypothetical protein